MMASPLHTRVPVVSVQKCSVVIWLSQSTDATAALCAKHQPKSCELFCVCACVIEGESVCPSIMGAGLGKESLSNLRNIGNGSYHCAMIGLDLSGKTTILYRLKFGQYTNTVPTIGFNCEKVSCPWSFMYRISILRYLKEGHILQTYEFLGKIVIESMERYLVKIQ